MLDAERDDNWLTTLVLTADAAAACGDREAAAQLYPRLLPHARLNATHLEMLVYFGCCSHWLGLLAALLGERARAAEHFETALEMNTNLGARPALARTSLEYGRFLLARDPAGAQAAVPVPPAAAQQARALIRDAASLAETLGLASVLHAARQLADG
jgi:tetratricopeptide (TPR) repeat protein